MLENKYYFIDFYYLRLSPHGSHNGRLQPSHGFTFVMVGSDFYLSLKNSIAELLLWGEKTMPDFDSETEEITAFEIGDTYIFKEYIDEDWLFGQLEKYYYKNKYRFEIPEEDLEEVRQIFEKYYYDLEVADSVEDYCVVVDRKSDSSDILRNSAMKKQRGQGEIIV